MDPKAANFLLVDDTNALLLCLMGDEDFGANRSHGSPGIPVHSKRYLKVTVKLNISWCQFAEELSFGSSSSHL